MGMQADHPELLPLLQENVLSSGRSTGRGELDMPIPECRFCLYYGGGHYDHYSNCYLYRPFADGEVDEDPDWGEPDQEPDEEEQCEMCQEMA